MMLLKYLYHKLKVPQRALAGRSLSITSHPYKNISHLITENCKKLLTLYITYDFLSSDVVRRNHNLHAITRPIASNTPEHHIPTLQMNPM